MRNPLASPASPPSPGLANFGLFLARAPLGAWLVLSGFARFTANSGGLELFVRRSLAAMPEWVPAAAGRPYLLAVPFAEIVLGAALILGIGGRVAGGLAAVLLGSLVILLDGVRGRGGLPFQPALLLTAVALLILLSGAGSLSMDRVMWNGAGSDKKRAP